MQTTSLNLKEKGGNMLKKFIAGLALALCLSGCMGHNGLTTKLLRWNLEQTENRWGRESIFVVMFPVYLVCALADMLVLNSMEFWSGENPINGKSPVVDIPKSEIDKMGLEDIEVAWIQRLNEGHALLYIEFSNGDRATFDVIRDQDTYTVSYAGVEFYTGKLSL